MSRTLVTAALPYANGPLHIGHLAGCYLPADIYVRYLRLNGRDVRFVCGSDEHGVAITMKARKEGLGPREIVDRYHSLIKESFERFGIDFDIYHRTSDPLHAETASAFFRNLYDKGIFKEEETEQYYDEEAGLFLADRYIVGTCPRCSNPSAYGDQCERCGSSLSPRDLINPSSQLSGKAPVLRKTKHWYLPLDEMQKEWLQGWIESKQDVWKRNVYGQCKSWLDAGLQPRAVTRDLDWGVPVPLDEAKGKVLYVWFDAPIGYISATRALLPTGWEKYWKEKETRLVHFIGKDNIVFHCIIFPAMLKAHGEYILPEQVPANEFLNLEGDKISTSRNWAVWLHEYLSDFPGKEDVLRYVLTAGAPETKDNDFTWKDFQDRNNNELVAVLGNFVNRTLVLTAKHFEGKVPSRGEMTTIDEACLKEMRNLPHLISDSLERYRFREAQSLVMDLARTGNKYLADTEPWKLIKTDESRVATILNVSLQLCAGLSVLLEPFLPHTSVKLRTMLNLGLHNWAEAFTHDLLKSGHALRAHELLFEKIEDEAIQAQVAKLQASKQHKAEVIHAVAEPEKAEVSYEDFSKMELRVATIIAAEKVEKADKLLKLTLQVGDEQRTVVSGIALHYKPEEIVGVQVSLLANLAPRKIRGIESRGMILMAENSSGELVFVSPSKPVVPGSPIS